jgi:hypothetical protein
MMTSSKQRFGKDNFNWKHGKTGTAIHRLWLSMLNRCRDLSNLNYGGRGITVCERWHSFTNFYADMGDRPSAEMSIERIDNDAGYSPKNCRWATRKEQGANRRTNRYVALNGERVIQLEAAKRLGLARCTISARIRKGWSGAELVKPCMHQRLSKEDVQWVRDWHAAGWSRTLLGKVLGAGRPRIDWILRR